MQHRAHMSLVAASIKAKLPAVLVFLGPSVAGLRLTKTIWGRRLLVHGRGYAYSRF